jgi:hypothetical protein
MRGVLGKLDCTYTTLGHRFERPFKHISHSQQLTPGSMETRSPTLKFLTFVPTSRICPADSCPRIISCVTQQSPILPVFQKWISDPQIPVAFWAGQARSKWKKEKTDHMDDTRVGWTRGKWLLLLPDPCCQSLSNLIARSYSLVILTNPKRQVGTCQNLRINHMLFRSSINLNRVLECSD